MHCFIWVYLHPAVFLCLKSLFVSRVFCSFPFKLCINFVLSVYSCVGVPVCVCVGGGGGGGVLK